MLKLEQCPCLRGGGWDKYYQTGSGREAEAIKAKISEQYDRNLSEEKRDTVFVGGCELNGTSVELVSFGQVILPPSLFIKYHLATTWHWLPFYPRWIACQLYCFFKSSSSL